MSIAATIARYLEDRSIPYQIKQHNPTGSTLESAHSAHVPSYTIAKGVLVKNEQQYLLVVIPGDRELDIELLNYEMDSHFQLATEAELQTVFTDCSIGAVPALGVAYALETVVDDALPDQQGVYFEGGDHQQLIYVNEHDFKTLIAGTQRLSVSRGFR